MGEPGASPLSRSAKLAPLASLADPSTFSFAVVGDSHVGSGNQGRALNAL